MYSISDGAISYLSFFLNPVILAAKSKFNDKEIGSWSCFREGKLIITTHFFDRKLDPLPVSFSFDSGVGARYVGFWTQVEKIILCFYNYLSMNFWQFSCCQNNTLWIIDRGFLLQYGIMSHDYCKTKYCTPTVWLNSSKNP